jgi:hypothetical protein
MHGLPLRERLSACPGTLSRFALLWQLILACKSLENSLYEMLSTTCQEMRIRDGEETCNLPQSIRAASLPVVPFLGAQHNLQSSHDYHIHRDRHAGHLDCSSGFLAQLSECQVIDLNFCRGTKLDGSISLA